MGAFFEEGRGEALHEVKGKRLRGGWRYQFQYQLQNYKSPRGFNTQRDALDAEAEHRRRLKLQAAGVYVPPTKATAASFQNWAGVYSEYVHSLHAKGLIKRPEIIDANLSSVLRFWGRRPTKPGAYVHPTGKYLDLTLADPIADPSLMRAFDEWMDAEGIEGSTRNHYNTTMSRMYWLALQAEYRREAGEPAYNPFAQRPRSKGKRRRVALSVDQIQAWIAQASYHVRIAMSVAALAPELRLVNVLQLTWKESHESHVDLANGRVIVWDHKTDADGKVIVVPITAQLQEILEDAKTRHPRSTHVVWYHGGPVKDIGGGVKAAAIAAGLTWGRSVAGGATFHTLRHSMNTFMGRMKIHPVHHQQAAGHKDFATTLSYSHLNVDDKVNTLEQLSGGVPIVGLVKGAVSRISRTKRGKKSKRGDLRGNSSRKKGAESARNGRTSGLKRGPNLARKKAPKVLKK